MFKFQKSEFIFQLDIVNINGGSTYTENMY